jgi:hypothetical protein
LSIAGLAEEKRFARVFRATWRQIPIGCRRFLVQYWRRNHQGRFGIPLPRSQRILREKGFLLAEEAEHGPLIQLIPECGYFAHPGHDAAAMCSRWGFWLQFLKPVVSRLNDRHLGILIAHELGHAYLFATGDMQEDDFNADLDVAELISTWDFDDDELEETLQALQPEITMAAGNVIGVTHTSHFSVRKGIG